ncbi:DUF1365 domain-containing protein [Planctobacterium marinum]|uniref:DUF1365 domain-containing protein n=1 Tax=Planctobacterium marinum TaxID=1631968 RepID=A0AA48KSL3_9ALTE|nr:DUF1365 domain-containing protein [Planctobacterium marinum]
MTQAVTSTNYSSALYIGETWHQRFVPKNHKFKYNIMMFWLDLDEVALLDQKLSLFSAEKFNWVQFRRGDFLTNNQQTLKQEVLQTMSEKAGTPLSGKVFLLSPLRILGMYFSPVNFYYLQNDAGEFSHLLAEVSNTPWNERHCYLVDLKEQKDSDKAFHVSPYNPIDMQYRWNIKPPGNKLFLQLDCLKTDKHFTAAIGLKRMELSNSVMRKSLFQFPHITLKTLFGIYWQALKLFAKRVPIYDHPKSAGR